MPQKILHGLDGSEGSFKALVEALALAKCGPAKLHLITVEEVPQYAGAMGEVIEAKDAANGAYATALERARQMAAAEGVEFEAHVFLGHEVKTIVEFVREGGYDLVRLAPCSVLVVK